jgi:hypothetical protein
MLPRNADPPCTSETVTELVESLRALDERLNRVEHARTHVEFENVIGIELLRERRESRRR